MLFIICSSLVFIIIYLWLLLHMIFFCEAIMPLCVAPNSLALVHIKIVHCCFMVLEPRVHNLLVHVYYIFLMGMHSLSCIVISWTIVRLTVIWRFNGFSMVILFVAGVSLRWFFISWSLHVHHSAWFSGDQYSILVLCVHHLVTLCDIIVSGSVLTLYCIRVCLVLCVHQYSQYMEP